jgi:endonuclease-8
VPEGDTVAGHAERLRSVLVGSEVQLVAGTAPSVRVNSGRILGATVTSVRSLGKNLVIDLSTGFSVLVHLGMNGRWQFGVDPKRTHGSARLALATSDAAVALYSAPTVEVDRTPAIDLRLKRLGPDLLGVFDRTEFLRRARAIGPVTMAKLLLDQRVWAGIGNVYKSELLFLVGIDPHVSSEDVGDEVLLEIGRLGSELLSLNVGRPRSTTGSLERAQETWVYGQAGHGCRRCGTRIEMGWIDDRVTYWCPTCQPPHTGRESTAS